MLDDGRDGVIAVEELTLEMEVVVVMFPPLPSGPQITRRIGNSFAQLLTRRAVLMAVGLAGNGGGSGWSDCRGAPDGRRDGPGGCEGVGGGMGDVAPDASVSVAVVPETPVGVDGEDSLSSDADPGNRDVDGDGKGSLCPLEKAESDAPPALMLLMVAPPVFSCVGVIDCDGLAGPLNVPGGCV